MSKPLLSPATPPASAGTHTYGDSGVSLSSDAKGTRWGESITPEGLYKLEAMQRVWAEQPEHERQKRPWEREHLTGADVFWLAASAATNDENTLDDAAAALLGLRESVVYTLSNLNLRGANLHGAHLEGAYLAEAHLEGANLHGAHLEGANLHGAHLEGANLHGAHLEQADVSWARLEGAYLHRTHLEATDLTGVWVDTATEFGAMTLNDSSRLRDIHWRGVGGVDLTQINWGAVPRLGDEHDVGLGTKLSDHEASVRAYRQISAQLRAQGMSEVADRFAYRAQVRQRFMYLRTMVENWRRPWRLPSDIARYLGSAALAVLAGYGYRPSRTVLWYLVTIIAFALGYFKVTHGASLFGLSEPNGTEPLYWYEALVLSVASFHGRGFFPQGISLGDPVAILASCEALIGLFVEISFISTFTQRFFGAK